MKEKTTYVLSIGMTKQQYYTIRELARREGTNASKFMYTKLDLDNMPLLPLPEGDVMEHRAKKEKTPEPTTEVIA